MKHRVTMQRKERHSPGRERNREEKSRDLHYFFYVFSFNFISFSKQASMHARFEYQNPFR